MSIRILQGDCRDVLKTLAEASVDAIVTDPPYELGFMGKGWDSTGVANDAAMWALALRVLKPGGHLLAFSGTRTYHRMVCAIEDAGFEIRDQLAWVYGSGFPKSHNGPWGGTALKPAWEPIVMARKPLIGTVEANWREHGTGALNIDGCRILVDGEERAPITGKGGLPTRHTVDEAREAGTVAQPHPKGRWPANLMHDGGDEVLAQFPAEAGAAAPVRKRNADKFRGTYGAFKGNVDEQGSTFQGDAGSAARFFYCAKADRADRNEGLDGMPARVVSVWGGDDDDLSAGKKSTKPRANTHPTVKPTDLMRWLVRLVTPPGGTVLDPFMGSGSTLKAAELEGFSAIGIELDPDYIAIAQRRIASDAPLFSQVDA